MIKFGVLLFILIAGLIFLGPIVFKEYSIRDASNPADDESKFHQFLTALTPSVGPEVIREGLALKSGLVIDVRNEDEYDESHIPGATNIPEQDLYKEIGEKFPKKNTLIYLYDNTGYGSGAATRLLISMGYERVFNMEGGFNKWKTFGYQVESLYSFPE